MSGWLAFLTWLGVTPKSEPKKKQVWFYAVRPLGLDPELWLPSITNAKTMQHITLHTKRSEAEGEKAAKKAILKRGGTPRVYVAPTG